MPGLIRRSKEDFSSDSESDSDYNSDFDDDTEDSDDADTDWILFEAEGHTLSQNSKFSELTEDNDEERMKKRKHRIRMNEKKEEVERLIGTEFKVPGYYKDGKKNNKIKWTVVHDHTPPTIHPV